MFSRLVSGFLLMFILARYLSLKDFGLFTFSLVVSGMIVLIIEYGYSIKLLKDTSKYKNKISELTSNSVVIKIILLLLIFLIFLSFYFLNLYTNYELYIFLLMMLSAIFNSFANHFLIPFRSIDRFDVEAKYVFLNNIMLFVLISGLAIYTKQLELVIYGFVFVKLIYMSLTFFLFQNKFGFKFSKINLYEELKNGFPFAVHIAVGAFYLNVDTLILKQYIPIEDIGIYQAGLKLLGALTIIMAIINNVLLPKLTSLRENNKNSFINLVVQFNYISIFVGLIIVIVINIFNREVIMFIFGENFMELNQYIFLFSIIIFLRYFGVVYGILLTISDNQKIRTYGVVFTLFFIILSDLFIIPRYEIYGALIVLILAHIILNTIYVFFTYKEYDKLFLTTFKGF
jgi:O-antigen/teichoic acid export membrane protein